jgi:translocator protein
MVIDTSPNIFLTRPGLGRLALWVALCLGGGIAIGLFFQPGAWFGALDHPAFAPPNWVFAPVWSTLYVMMAVAMWRVERSRDPVGVGAARNSFLGQLAVNFLWTPVFFGMHAIPVALGIIVMLWFGIGITVVLFHRLDRLAACLLLPYWAWVSFATALNAVYFYLN